MITNGLAVINKLASIKMKNLISFVLILLTFCGYAQNRTFKGTIYSKFDDGCVVIAEPSGIHVAITWDYPNKEFNINCPKTDTSLVFIFSNSRLNYKIDLLSMDSIINVDSLFIYHIGKIPYQKNEFQIIINDIGLPNVETTSYLINNFGIRVSRNWYYGADSMIEKDHYDYYKYLIDTKVVSKLVQNLAIIIKNIKQGDYEGNWDDGQELEIKIIYNENYYSYMFHNYYKEKINDLIETINNVIKDDKKINYSWLKKLDE